MARESCTGSYAGRPGRAMGGAAMCGFTLLEMVIAIAIFAVIGAISYGTLDNFLSLREALAARNEQNTRLARAIGHFERDVRFMASRPVRDGLGENVPALAVHDERRETEGLLMELTALAPSLAGNAWHRPQRVGWVLRDGVLIRQVWPVLDRDLDSAPHEAALADRVAVAEIRFYGRDEDGGIDRRAEWDDPFRLPEAVELTLTLDDGATYRRLVEVTGAAY